ncbi:phage tail tape measure protein [Corynebacterium hindlerae]|uniref:Phage tail tape measure protein n=1 Tax=Corynebacterium hindlerae TaxID=699041 RepID=A0A7G5FBV6_9CORY|nr:phage tail tape measure protein [Corynebacterium hindlerae]QMV84097.1 phage tail tape measure protein [Corynebacterium hindlerae]
MGLDLGKLSATVEVRADGVENTLSKVEQGLDKIGRKVDDVSKKQIKPKADSSGVEKLSSASNKTKTALDEVGKKNIKPRVDTGDIDKAERSAGNLKNTLGSIKGVAGVALGVAGIAGVSDALGAVVTAGNDYTNQMNIMKAVSGATEQQLKSVGKVARELGNDVDLPATSAGDAAAAMSELAKGGFTVEQSMQAAKGTLQLAAASGIEAAQAATIQSQALQAFGLDASYAAKTADVLANSANASSAEITGIAQGLQQSGAVANQFGLSLEDTAASLGMLANAGIQGSDAGTLLKTTLLALTDQGKPAQQAMQELGLTVYDTNGKFVGMSSLMGQLEKASKSMSEEQYQAATATLFGSDAMRLAGVAAQQGQAGFDKMREAVEKEGAAAEVAAAKTEGLPGAISQVSNAAEELGLKLYDLGKGPAEAGLKQLASGITAISDNMDRVPFPAYAAGVAALVTRFTGLNTALNTGTGNLAKFAAETRAVKAAADAQGKSIGSVNASLQVLGQHSPTIERMHTAYQKGAPGLQLVAQKHKALAAAAKLSGSASKDSFTVIDRMGAQAAHSFVASTAKMGNAATGFARGGLSLMKSGMGSLMGALGGPWGLAIMGASFALGKLAEEHMKAKQAEEDHKAAVDQLTESLNAQSGATTQATRDSMLNRAEKEGALVDASKAGFEGSTVVDAMMGQKGALAEIKAQADGVTASFNEVSKATRISQKDFEAFGVTNNDLARALGGNEEAMNKVKGAGVSGVAAFEDLKSKLSESELASLRLAEATRAASGDLDEATQAAKRKAAADNNLVKAAKDTSKAMGLLRDSVLAVPDSKTLVVKAGPEVEDARQKLEELGAKVSQPFNGEVRIEFPNGIDINTMLDELGVKVSTLPEGRIKIDNPDAPEVLKSLELLGLKTTTLPTGEIVIDSNDPEVTQRMVELGILVKNGANGTVTISDNFDPTLAKIREVNENDGKKTSQEHTIVNRIQEWREYYGSGRTASTSGTSVGQHYSVGGRLPRNASGDRTHGGYRLPLAGPGTDRTDGILGVDAQGIPVSWVDRGEWITNRKRSSMYNRTLAAINRGTPNQILAALANDLPRHADGGVSDKVKQALAGMNGTPYVFGGWSTAGTDCSGAVSMAVNAAEGLDPFDSRTTTMGEAAWLEAKGYQRGKGGPGDMRVAFLNGGPGGGHTAIQLPDGTYIESGGNTGGGLTIGGAAGPLEGRGFTDWYFKPMGTGDGGVSVGGNGSQLAGTSTSASGSGGSVGGSVSRPQVSISDGSMSVFQAGQRMGIGGGLGALALVNENTVAAFNDLEKAREDEISSVEAIAEAEEKLAEARENAAKAGDATAEKVAEKERALAKAREKAADVDQKSVDEIAKKEESLAKAREKGDPDKIAKAEEDLAKARDAAPKKARDAADKIAKAERELKKAREAGPEKAKKAARDVEQAEENLRNAREQSVVNANRTAAAERQYRLKLAQAPFEQAASLANAFGGIFSAVGGMYQAMADAERRKLDQAKEALGIWQRQIDAQKAVQDATEASTEAMREQVKARWQSDLAVSDAEWELTMHRKRSQKELSEAVLFGINVTEMKAKTERRTAVLEAQIAFEKAQRDLTAFLRDKQLADSAFEMERSHKLAAIQTSRLALVAGALARIQGALNIEEMKALEIKAIKAQGMATSANGLGGIVGGIGGLIGALGMAAVNPLGALAAGAAAIGGIISGAGQMRAGRAQVKAAEEQQRALQNVGKGDPKLIPGLDGKSLEALDLQEQQLEIQMSQDRLQRQKDAAKQHDLLQQLVDNAEKNLEYAKRDERRADDLASLWDDGNSLNATAFFQFGGSGWAGGAKQFTGATGGGFGGLREARLSPESSMVVENGAQKAARLGLPSAPVTSPENVTASTSLLNLRETKAMRVTMDDLLGLVERIEAVVANGGVQDNVGAVFNGDVTLVNHDAGNADNRALAAALARKG